MNNRNHHSPSPSSSRRATTRVSPFFRDLASPIAASRHRLRLPSASPLAGDPPPPPLFSLDDDLSPDRDVASPSSWTPPVSRSASLSSPFLAQADSFRARLEEASGSGEMERRKEKGKGLAEESHVAQSGALVVYPTVDVELKKDLRRNEVVIGERDEEVWVTVFGFYPSDTNLVLREFEKCGVILRHIVGPRDANWIHILYQKQYEAKRALERDGTQINSSVIIGVKLVNPMEKKILNEKINNNNNQNKMNQNGFRVSTLPAVRGKSNTVTVNGPHRPGNVAVPAKSFVNKAMDLVFGM